MFALSLAAAVLAAGGAAIAQPGQGSGPGSREFRGPPPGRDMPRRDDEWRRQHRDEWRQREMERRQQLSPEERRELRRDIRDHGRDVYGDRQRGRDRDR